jgi:hypothetical protein
MKILSSNQLELPECKIKQFTPYETNHYSLVFQCGLVMSSWFFRRLGETHQISSFDIHARHHSDNHKVGEWGYALYKWKFRSIGVRFRANKGTLACGDGCSNSLKEIVVLDRSDINFKPLAQIRDGDRVFEIKMTAGRKAFCTCSPGIDLGILCKHMEKLIVGQQKGLLGLDDNYSPILSRKMLLE